MRPCVFSLFALAISAPNFVRAGSEPQLEGATLHSLGYYWIVPADPPNRTVRVEWRSAGETAWRIGPPLVRVARRARLPANGRHALPLGAKETLFAGSLVSLQPNTEYELRFGDSEQPETKVRRTRTLAEPRTPRDAITKHVIPGNGGGAGTMADPYRGLDAAQAGAEPGDLFLIEPGIYPAPFTITKSGQLDRPIIWRGAGKGDTILAGAEGGGKRGGRAVMANDAHDVWFERLAIRNVQYGLTGHEAARIVIRHCSFAEVEYGIAATRNERGTLRGWFITDNSMEGPCHWPRSKGIESARGIQLTGEGHVIAYNRVVNFADGIDTFPSQQCANIDIHHNDIAMMTDDGIELDYAERNVRCFANRLTNVFQGISLQPILGGPVYVFRNLLYNVVAEPFKMHNSPVGAHLYHNTSVKHGTPFFVSTPEPVHHVRSRNNLFVGTKAPYACEMSAPMDDCDFDFDGFAGGPWGLFLKWNGARFGSLAEVQKNAPVYRNAMTVEPPVFAEERLSLFLAEQGGPEMRHPPADLRLHSGSNAADRGERLPGFNDDFTKNGPDLGAYELGAEPPAYGPRADRLSDPL